jgi:hypothetical protein
MEMYELVVRGFERAGWPMDRIIAAVVALECFILGSAMDSVAPPDVFSPGDAAEHVPTLSAAVVAQDRAVPQGAASEAAFELGLSAMIAGLGEMPISVTPE